jgi:hypothetical protein
MNHLLLICCALTLHQNAELGNRFIATRGGLKSKRFLKFNVTVPCGGADREIGYDSGSHQNVT